MTLSKPIPFKSGIAHLPSVEDYHDHLVYKRNYHNPPAAVKWLLEICFATGDMKPFMKYMDWTQF